MNPAYIDKCIKAKKELKQYRPIKKEYTRDDGSVFVSHIWNDGDFVFIPEDVDDEYYSGVGVIFDDRVCNSGFHDYDGCWYIPEGTRWLPRPDQLIEILGKHYDRNDWGVLEYFNYWYDKQEIDLAYCSFHEMWLMFYMYAVHNKKWEDNNWIVIEV